MPRRLYYLILSLVLTGLLASLEANSSFGSQQLPDNQPNIYRFLDSTGLTSLIKSSYYDNVLSL